MEKKSTFWKIVLTLSIIGCLLCVGFVGWYFYQSYTAKKQYEQLQAEMEKEAAEAEADEELEEEENEPTLEEIESVEFTGERQGEAIEIPEDFFVDMENPIDFKKLEEVNTDIYAWIRIPDTMIDYPIAQRAGDDTYYLSHDMYREPRFAGCIYTEDCNDKDFMDPNTVIYGHNMKNQTMFQNLHLFRDKKFFDEHPLVYIYTPEGVLQYKVFAAYTYDDRHIMNSFDFGKEDVFEKYLDDIYHVRAMDKNLREEIQVSSINHIITLSTCIGGQPQSRYLVQAVLSKDENNE